MVSIFCVAVIITSSSSSYLDETKGFSQCDNFQLHFLIPQNQTVSIIIISLQLKMRQSIIFLIEKCKPIFTRHLASPGMVGHVISFDRLTLYLTEWCGSLD